MFVVDRWRADRVSALLFIPYAAWVAFASVLNAAIVVLN
jgi:tryptophan-rich sensory protein